MTPSSGWLLAAVVATSMGATASLDQLIKQVRARHRIGVIAYSAYSRAADFHTGLLYYVPIIISWLVVIPVAAIVGWKDGASGRRSVALTAMVVCLAAHMVVTGVRAAPILLSQREVPHGDEPRLTVLFERFQRWHFVRTLIDVGALGSSVWALVATMEQ